MNSPEIYKVEHVKANKDLKFDKTEAKIVPKLIPVDCSHLEALLTQGVDEEFLQPLMKIHRNVFSKLQTFDPDELKAFEFVLPDTLIPKKGVLAIYEHDRKKIEKEDLSTRSLTNEQVKEVFRRGCFRVKSKKYNQDYVWQVSTFLVKGTERILESFYKDLSWAFYHIYQIKKRIVDSSDKNTFSLARGLENVMNFFPNLVLLLIGYPMFNNNQEETQKRLALQIKRMELLESDANVDWTWHKYIYEKPEMIKALRHFQKSFRKLWSTRRSELVMNMQADEFQNSNLLKEQYEAFYRELEKDETFVIFGHSKKIRESFLSYYKAAVIINKEEYDISLEVDKYYTKMLEEAQTKYIIKSKIKGYVEKEIEKRTSKFRDKLLKQRDTKILEQLTMFPAQKYLFLNYLSFVKNFEKNVKHFRLKSEETTGLHTYYFRKYYDQPGKAVYDERTGLYRLEIYSLLSQGTEKWAWRISLMVIRYRVWSNNTFYYLRFSAFFGLFGFHRLSMRSFYYPFKKLNENTGQIIIIKEQPEFTIIGRIKHLCNLISERRRAFEAKPNRGFFPKGCSRIYNYLETYIYLGLIQGVGLTLMLHLGCILILAPTFFVLCYTSPLWMICVIFFHRIFQICLLDEDNRRGFLTNITIPLPFEVFKLFFLGFFQIVFSLFGIFFHPIIALLILVISVVRMIIRKIFDVLMISVIYCLGRVPHNNSSMAWMISGPGIYKSNYVSMEIEDVIYLFINYIEILEIENYMAKIEKAINHPEKTIRPYLDRIGGQLKMDVYKSEPKELINSTRVLTEKMRNAVQKRRNQLHEKKIPNVRFTEKELVACLTILEGHLKDLYSRKELYFIWEKLSVDEMDFLSLTKKILSEAFDPGILYPLEEIATRTKLVANREREFGQLFEILEGKTGNAFENLKALETQRQEIVPFKGNFLPTPGFLSVDYILRLTSEIIGKNLELSLALDPSHIKSEPNKVWIDREIIIPVERDLK